MYGIRLLSTSLLALYAAAGVRATAGDSLFDSAPLDDAELAQARGGFTLPNGMTIDFGIIVSTVVNGTRVLQTEMRVLGDTITTSVTQAVGTQAEKTAEAVTASITVPIVDATDGGTGGPVPGDIPAGSAVESSAPVPSSSLPGVSATPGGGASVDVGGVSVNGTPGAGVSVDVGGVSVSATPGGGGVADVSSGSANPSGVTASPDTGVQVTVGSVTVSTDAGGTTQVAVSGGGLPAGPGSQTAVGQAAASTDYVSTQGTAPNVSASAILPQLLIEHEIGRSISSFIVNTGDGRVIDNRLMIDLTIGNVQPYSIGSIGYRVQSLGLDAAIWRGSGG
ncbi:hypothetical protein GCM10007897_43550 [Sphingobium jiangsuense]|uniref:Uncharacterized protein n=1 Tax=Sphingobium jiangsuense TaxID=870476 RepID=A0A7W6FSN9_9SPHN|nr:hypothetical protein [Sphingobium jiangsuense]MBB3928947.1 hypothetical protein [Sphingobium jiangsuense]GLT02925.1 hypothetical protein GCM10007897_43550 [Sphingobium jiangsuense]